MPPSARRVRGDAAESSPSARFRNALSEAGGLYSVFAQFLCWRADLLSTEYLGQLRTIRVAPGPISHDRFLVTLFDNLPENARTLAEGLEANSCWSTFLRCAYRSQVEGRPVVVEALREPRPDSDAAFRAFERGVTSLAGEDARRAVAPEALAQFKEWVRLGASLERQRNYQRALHGMRSRLAVGYPGVLEEFSAGPVLCYEWLEGEAVSKHLAEGLGDVGRKVAQGLLEQLCIAGIVDGDFDPEAMVVMPDGKLGLRRPSRMIAVPPALTAATLKYISAVLAGNAPAAAHALAKLAATRTAGNLEEELLERLSELEPELKVHLQFPKSAAIFEGNWRALARTDVPKPLYLDLMHRNLIAVGYWNAENGGPSGPDYLAEEQWPVIGRLLRLRLGELASRDRVSEWFVGSGLLFFEGLRQFGRLADEFRDNELSIGVDFPSTREASRQAGRRIRSGIFIGMLVVVFLVSVRWAWSSAPPWSTGFSLLAGAAAVSLFWMVARIE
ncbi:MAG: hypothetical protein WD696_19450 [Bryobacteraceae bacterium]